MSRNLVLYAALSLVLVACQQFQASETFDIGIDNGTQVDPNYEGSPFPFTGTLDRVTFTLTD